MAETQLPASKSEIEAKVTLISKASGALVSNSIEVEDEFSGLYETAGVKTGGHTIIRPPYDPNRLIRLVSENNALGPCIDAMEMNVDGTGFVLEPETTESDELDKLEQQLEDLDDEERQLDDQEAAATPPKRKPVPADVTSPQQVAESLADREAQDSAQASLNEAATKRRQVELKRREIGRRRDKLQAQARQDAKIKRLQAFFDEPYPGTSWLTQRRRLRRDIETLGYGFLEVMRNLAGEIVFLRHIPGQHVRLLKLDEPVEVEKSIVRLGQKLSVKMWVRERRFVQMIGNKMMYFREFGASRHLNKDTGNWESQTDRVTADRRATEILYFTAIPDSNSPYGLPRWITQLPSVLGSRQAEEHNLAYFDRGGVPPALIIVQGGAFADETRRALDNMFSASSKEKHQVAILEAYSTGGSLDSSGNVRVTVERFGSERVQDAMFQGYDQNCFNRIRQAFRLPEIFVGDSQSMNFATAQASYMVAEEQVFAPERREFDEVINTRLLPELEAEGLKHRSLPLQIKSVDTQLKGLELAAASQVVKGEQLLKAINEVADLDIPIEVEPLQGPDQNAAPAPAGEQNPLAVMLAQAAKQPAPAAKADQLLLTQGKGGVLALALECSIATRKRDWAALGPIMARVLSLPHDDREEFDRVLAKQAFVNPEMDEQGIGQLVSSASLLLAGSTS